mgnify:CR=1 FL=1
MLKYILFSIVALLATVQTGYSQWENDPKGIGYQQLYGCRDTTGVRLDSMFRMTDTTGKLNICLSIGDLIDIINNYGGDGGGGGEGSNFGCDSVEICLEDGLLCDILKGFPTGNYTTGNRLFGVDNGGMCKRLDIMNITGVGDTCRVVNNSSGSYTHTNENGTQKEFGYHLVCKNDSTLVLTDWDGTHIDSCTLSFTGGGSGDLDCDSVKACVSEFLCDSVKACLERGALCETLSGLDEADTEEGDKYVTIKDGQCVLTDSIYIDICGILQEIQEESDLAEDDIAFILRGENCFKVPISTRSTDCINVEIDAGDIIATPNISADPGNTIECRDDGFYAAAELDFNCDSLKEMFPSGTYDSNDHILSFDGTTDECEWITIPQRGGINCDSIKSVFNQIGTSADTILGFSDGNCVRVSVDDLACPQNLNEWDGDCSPAWLLVQCFVPGQGWQCQRMPCTEFDNWYEDGACNGQTLKSPFSPLELRNLKEEIKEGILEEIKSDNIQPSAMTSSFSTVDYPTVDNIGIRTFKSKRQAEISEIPIGGIYYIAGKGNMYVKTRQRK